MAQHTLARLVDAATAHVPLKSAWARYGVAVAAVAILLGLRQAMNPFLDDRFPLMLLYPAVFLSAWTGGLGPGVLATLLAMLGAFTLFIEPKGWPLPTDFAQAIAAGLFLGIGALISLLSDGLHRARRDALAHAQTLAENDARLHLALDAAVMAESEWDLREGFLKHSPALNRLFGFADPDRPTDQQLLARIHPDDRERVIQTTGHSHGGPRPYRVEYRVLWPDGSIHWLASRGEVLRDPAGAPQRIIGVTMCITEQKRTEEALRESEEKFRSLAENAQAIIGIVQGRRFIYANPYLERISGYSLDEWLSNDIDRFIHPDFRQLVVDRAGRRQLGEDVPSNYDFVMLTKSGEERWLNLSLARITLKGRPAVVGVAYDITGLKRAQETLRRNEQFKHAILNSLTAELAVLDRDGNIVAVNDAWLRFARDNGNPPLDRIAVGANYLEVCRRAVDAADPTAAEALDGIRAVLEQRRRTEFSYEYACPSPTVKAWYVMSVVPLPREIGGAVVSHINITERKQAEEAMRQSEARLRLATEAARIGEWEWNLLTGQVTRSAQQLRLFGRADQQLPADIASFHQTMHPDDRQRVIDRMRQAMTNGGQFQIEFRTVWPDGSVHWLLDQGEVLRGRDGRPERLIGVTMNIDQRKHEEEQRAEWLRREQAARRDAEEANRMKDDFLATVSHELRTPLTAILGWARLLHSGNTDKQSLEEGLAAIERNAKAQAQLIEDLLDLSRIITGRVRLNIEPLELAQVIHAALETVSPAARARNIRLLAQLSLDAGLVHGDPTRLQQVVWNLVSNAVKFTNPGGQVTITLTRDHSRVRVSVSDTGRGIAPEFLPHVFERFRQADPSSKRQHGGLGLGLAIVRHLIELHGGTVWAESPGLNQGSTFTFELPVMAIRPQGLSRPEQPHAPNSAPPNPAAIGPRVLEGVRVLAVDDEPDARQLISTVLERCGAQVVTVSSAAEALAVIEHINHDPPPNVMVSDIAMPGEDGYELIRKVRLLDQQHGRHLPAAALTAYARPQDRDLALQAGYQRYLAKPVEPRDLVATVAELAGRPTTSR